MTRTSSATPELRALVEAATYISVKKPATFTEMILCQRYLERPKALADAFVPIGIRERDGGGGPEDPRADASHWLRYYAAAVATLPLMGLAVGASIDVSAGRVGVMVYDGVPTHVIADPAREVEPGTRREDLRAEVFEGLFAKHLIPLVDRILDLVKLDRRVLWSDIGESIDCLYAAALEKVVPEVKAAIEADRELIFGADRLPGVAGPNLLKGSIVYQIDAPEIYPHAAQVREMCCVVFHIRTPQEYCRNCPIPTPVERATMMKDWSIEVRQRANTP